jgi:hypothetical protein
MTLSAFGMDDFERYWRVMHPPAPKEPTAQEIAKREHHEKWQALGEHDKRRRGAYTMHCYQCLAKLDRVHVSNWLPYCRECFSSRKLPHRYQKCEGCEREIYNHSGTLEGFCSWRCRRREYVKRTRDEQHVSSRQIPGLIGECLDKHGFNCDAEIKAALHPPPPSPKTCERCSKPFESKRYDARYCGGACRVAAHRAKAKG